MEHQEEKNLDCESSEVRKKEKKKELVEWIKSLFIAVIIAILIKTFLVEGTKIEGQSMYPTLHHNDRLFVNKISTYFRAPERGEIIVFHAPDADREYIKRVIGIPGDVVEIADGDVFVNNQKLEESYIETGLPTFTMGEQRWEVPEGQFFVLGDNRQPGQSKDSRYFGCIMKDQIVGYASIRFFPLSALGNVNPK